MIYYHIIEEIVEYSTLTNPAHYVEQSSLLYSGVSAEFCS